MGGYETRLVEIAATSFSHRASRSCKRMAGAYASVGGSAFP